MPIVGLPFLITAMTLAPLVGEPRTPRPDENKASSAAALDVHLAAWAKAAAQEKHSL